MTMQVEVARREDRLSRAFQRNRVFLALTALHLMAAVAAQLALGTSYEFSFVTKLVNIFTNFVPVFVLAIVAWRFGVMAVCVRPAKPIASFLDDMRAIFLDPDRIITGMIALLALPAFSMAAMYFKSVIPLLSPFSWDQALAAADRALHGGVDPYRLLLPLTGTPGATALINLAYHGWFFLMYFFLFLACFARGDGGAGRTFMVGYVLIWLLGGNLMATLFSSAGPVYFERLGLGADFAPLMNRLETLDAVTPIWALNVQEIVWERYRAGNNIGISAMPSMHLATSTLMALYALRRSRIAGGLMIAFVGIILAGSVHLGWHYALDSYAGILVALACWKAACWLITWDDSRDQPHSRSRAT